MQPWTCLVVLGALALPATAACAAPKVVRVPASAVPLLAARGASRFRTRTVHRSASRLLPSSSVIGRPLPIVLAVAATAALGPPTLRSLRSSLRGLGPPPWSPDRPASPGRISKLQRAGSSTYRPDGALEEARTARQADELLRAWRAGRLEEAVGGRSMEEAAIGLALLQWVESTRPSLATLKETTELARRVVASRTKQPPSLAAALRKASTAAARRCMGLAATGDELAVGVQDRHAGALLLLCQVLLDDSAHAGLEAAAVRAAFGLQSELDRGERLRVSAGQDLIRAEARLVLPRVSSAQTAGPLEPATIRAVAERLGPLAARLHLRPHECRGPLLAVAMDPLRALTEGALSQWLSGREPGVPSDGPGGDGGGRAYRTATSAARLASSCLAAFDGPARSGWSSLGGGAGGRAGERRGGSVGELRPLGLTSQARHEFYVAYVRAACVAEAEAWAAAAGGTGLGPRPGDAVVLRRLLAVLPTEARRGEAEAVEAAAAHADELAVPDAGARVRELAALLAEPADAEIEL